MSTLWQGGARKLRRTSGRWLLATEHHARTTESADHARAVLARLVTAMGPHVRGIVIIGGLAAPRLAPRATVPHEGTTDIDLLFEVAMDYDLEDSDPGAYAWLQEALLGIGARPGRPGGYWRWSVDGVTIDLLCDRYPNEHRGEVNLPGARMVTVMQLPGPAAALQDARDEAVDPSLPGSPIVAVAGLGGYLLAKAGAAGSRGEPRDHYDFWW